MRKLLDQGCLVFIWPLVLLASTSALSEDISRDEAEALMASCEAQREALIAPEREEAIEWCVERRRRSLEYCESYHRTYGARRPRGNGTWQPGLYWDLPDCVKALEAERFFRVNPGRQVYTP